MKGSEIAIKETFFVAIRSAWNCLGEASEFNETLLMFIQIALWHQESYRFQLRAAQWMHTPQAKITEVSKMSHTTASEFWFSLLFNVVSIPFALLLIVMVAKQSVSVRDYSAEVESARNSQTSGLVGETFF
ncbi:MAG: hypothetical protein AAFO84_11335 [Cyanobacteria bacterium J06598_1]